KPFKFLFADRSVVAIEFDELIDTAAWSVLRHVDVARFAGPFQGKLKITLRPGFGLPEEIANRSSSFPTRLMIVFIHSPPAPRGLPPRRSGRSLRAECMGHFLRL